MGGETPRTIPTIQRHPHGGFLPGGHCCASRFEQMQSTGLASRYARALSEVVQDKAELERTASQLDAIADLYRGSKDLRDFLRNPARPLDAKRKGLQGV